MIDDYLRNFIAEKRSAGVPWSHIAIMSNKPMSSLQPYKEMEEGYKASAERKERERLEEIEDARLRRERMQAGKTRRGRDKDYVTFPPEMRLVAAKIADEYGVRYDHVISRTARSEGKDIIFARQHIMWKLLAKNYSAPLIGDFLDGRDHSTIIKGAKRHVLRTSKLSSEKLAIRSASD